MSITRLPTNYADEVVTERKYKLTYETANEVLVEDVSEYSSEGSSYTAKDMKQTSSAVNEVIDLAESNNDKLTAISGGRMVIPVATEATLADNATTATNANRAITATTATTADTAGSSADDFIVATKQHLIFVNKECTISDDRITEDSLAEVYFTPETVGIARKAVPSVETSNGSVTITVGRNPSASLYATIRIRRIE